MKPIKYSQHCHRSFWMVIFTLFLTISPTLLNAQNENPADLKVKARALLDAQKMTEALPLYEKLAQLTPNDEEVHLDLGFSLLGQAANTDDPETRRQLRIRARNAFSKSRELGNETLLVKGLIDGLPLDGSDAKGFSDNTEANKLMGKGEAAFSSGKLDDALAAYQGALKIDPKCYFAALFAGDVYKERKDFANAEISYQKAIAIDQKIETAYRYSATPLMLQRKFDQARDRYIEAFIVEPYNSLALSGLVSWGQITNTQMGHPKIDPPEFKIGADGKSNSTINVNPLADDGSLAWIGYTATRSEWYKKKFKQNYPAETAYRHTLQEEAEAFRSVLAIVKETKAKTRNLNPQLATLLKLDQEGLLEAYILIAIPDQGIAQDHPAYLKVNRDKLRQYVIKYVIDSGK